MREWPDCSNTTITSPSLVLISSASTSARGIITSSTRTSRNLQDVVEHRPLAGREGFGVGVGFGQRVGDFLAQAGAVARLEQAGQPLEERGLSGEASGA